MRNIAVGRGNPITTVNVEKEGGMFRVRTTSMSVDVYITTDGKLSVHPTLSSYAIVTSHHPDYVVLSAVRRTIAR